MDNNTMRPNLKLVEDDEQNDDAFEDMEYQDLPDSEEAFLNECEEQRKKNDQYLDEFEESLKQAGLSEKTIERHLMNVRFYLNTYLLKYDPLDMVEGCYSVDEYLGYFFIRKCMWSTPKTIRENVTAFKKFYKCMLERGHISQKDFDALLESIKLNMDNWIADCEEFNTPSEDFFPGGFDADLFGAVYNTVAHNLGLADMLGVPPLADEFARELDDANFDEDELFTKEEVETYITLVLLYLTSVEEKDEQGNTVRCSLKPARQSIENELRDQGFIEDGIKPEFVALTKRGENEAIEYLCDMGFDYLV